MIVAGVRVSDIGPFPDRLREDRTLGSVIRIGRHALIRCTTFVEFSGGPADDAALHRVLAEILALGL